jgi:hypothetical protein
MNTSIETMSLVDLKKLAKERRIKHYYVMKREQLLALLKMEALPTKYKLEKLTIQELRNMAKEKGLRGFWSLHREDLLNMLFPENKDTVQGSPANKQNQNEGKAEKHQNPEGHHAENVGVEVSEDPLKDRT